MSDGGILSNGSRRGREKERERGRPGTVNIHHIVWHCTKFIFILFYEGNKRSERRNGDVGVPVRNMHLVKVGPSQIKKEGWAAVSRRRICIYVRVCGHYGPNKRRTKLRPPLRRKDVSVVVLCFDTGSYLCGPGQGRTGRMGCGNMDTSKELIKIYPN